MRIPEIRERLLEIATEINNPEIADLALELKRRPPAKKAPAKSREVTPELAARIRHYALSNRSASQVEIARVFNVNPGRVSEVVAGKRQ